MVVGPEKEKRMTRIARVAWLIAIPFRIVLAATLILAATAALLRSRPIRALSCRLGWCRCAFLEGSDGSEIVGMPTRIRQSGTTASGVPWSIDWDAFFADTKELN